MIIRLYYNAHFNEQFFSIADDIKREICKQDEANVNKPDETIPGTKCTVNK